QEIVSHFNVNYPYEGFLFGVGFNAPAGHLGFFASNSTSNSFGQDPVSAGTVNDGQFHHVAVSYDGTHVTFYIDGQLDSVHTFSSPILIGNPTDDMRIGADTNPTVARPFVGIIDELGIWNRQLSTGDIQQVYNASGPLLVGARIESNLIG